MNRIAVLMTVHNRREKTLSCLERLFGQKMPTDVCMEVFMTDDGCTDGTAEAVAERFPQVHIVSGDGTLFWCRGMVKAWQAALQEGAYDVFLWLNDDTLLMADALMRLRASSARHPGCIIVGPTCSAETGILTYGGRSGKGHVEPGKEEMQVDTFDGNIVWVPEGVFQSIGMLDNRFSHAMGDTEYGLRARRAGISKWQLAGFAGYCEEHGWLADWCNPEVPFRQRWKALRTPLGCPPEEFFICDRYHGYPVAVLHYITIHLRVLFPRWWSGHRP
ncbi:MAG: glycosyltransferase family 2 protein [Bacteroidales bacterium]|nr:glycosyltransferase family 2 protein [Bacteroidales bacterium]